MHVKPSFNTALGRWVIAVSLSWLAVCVQAAPKPEAIKFWQASDEANIQSIDHSGWQMILQQYLSSNHASGINRFGYQAVDKSGLTQLDSYLHQLQNLDPRTYSKAQQQAYWINLYNALTVKVILDNYPVPSITKTGEGFFSFGPWDDKAAVVQGQELSLNDIEHGILRPIWQDNRIHYAVNCASLGCPNLAAEAFTADNMEALLEHSAASYVNHSRGVRFDDGELIVSSIFHWYKVDFGGTDQTLLNHLQKYAQPDLRAQLKNYQGAIAHDYDWSLNQP